MSTTDQTTNEVPDGLDPEQALNLDLRLEEAEALRTWLLKPAGDGSTSLDDPLVSRTLARLGQAVDEIRATVNVRRELAEAGLDVERLSDEQVRDLGRRVTEAALPGLRP